MKKKRLLVVSLCIAAILISGALFMAKNGIGFSVGPCIANDDGRYLIVIDNSPISLHQRSGKESIFPELDTGDRIFVIHDGIAETYPGKTGLFFILKLSDGNISDVPEEILNQLHELGWHTK